MDISNLALVLLLAFPVGMLHALDADHIAAVTGMIDKRGAIKHSVFFCLSWAMGHSVTLLVIGTVIFMFSMTIPESVSVYAEALVGVLLVVIGASILLDIYRKKIHLHFHQHDDQPVHAHWHSHKKKTRTDTGSEHGHAHKAVLVGVLHGAAGYAPLIAVIPLAINDSPWFALLYLLVFGLGVFLSMLMVGGVLGFLLKEMAGKSLRVMNIFRSLVATVSMLIGVTLLNSVVAV